MIRLFIADDHKIFIDGLLLSFMDTFDIRVVGHALNGREALDKLRETEADVILLDINMPEMNGLECARNLQKKFPALRVIILSQYGEPRVVKKLRKYNISGYLLKDSPKEEVIEAVKTVAGGGEFFSKSLNLEDEGRTTDDYGYLMIEKLSTREREVLEGICNEMNNQEIAAKLQISVHTVETIRFRLMNKTGSRNMAGLVKWAILTGALEENKD